MKVEWKTKSHRAAEKEIRDFTIEECVQELQSLHDALHIPHSRDILRYAIEAIRNLKEA